MERALAAQLAVLSRALPFDATQQQRETLACAALVEMPAGSAAAPAEWRHLETVKTLLCLEDGSVATAAIAEVR